MSNEKDSDATERAGDITFKCPNVANTPVGATFTVCGTFTPAFRCDKYEVRMRANFLDLGGKPKEIKVIAKDDDSSKWKGMFTLSPLPAEGGGVLISAQLFNKATGGVLSPERSITVTYQAGTPDPCEQECKSYGVKKND